MKIPIPPVLQYVAKLQFWMMHVQAGRLLHPWAQDTSSKMDKDISDRNLPKSASQ